MVGITGLPDEIVRRILGLLGANDVARVLVLSKRFRNLHTIMDLALDDSVDPHETFSEFVGVVLAALEFDTCLRKFSLHSRQFLDPALLNLWLRGVLKRNVVILGIGLHRDNRLPSELFTCPTVAKLELGEGTVVDVIPKNAFLPNLKVLALDSVRFSAPANQCAFMALLLSCPVMKELIIYGMKWETWGWSGSFSSQSLERLSVHRDLSPDFQGPEYQAITFQTPSLKYLDYADFVPDAYAAVNFESLVEARLDLQVVVNHQLNVVAVPWEGAAISSDPTNLFQGIRNVKILDLASPSTFEALYYFRAAIPVFENLNHITLTHAAVGLCWRFLPYLLSNTPNLQMLSIENGLHFGEEPDYVCECVSGYACLLTCPVEALDIELVNDGSDAELAQIEQFLGKLPRLDLLEVRSRRPTSVEEQLRIATAILRLPRASPDCRVHTLFEYY